MSIFSLSLIPATKTNVNGLNVMIELENHSNQDYLISSDSILWDGFTSNKFNIVEPYGTPVFYIGRNVKYTPSYIFLKQGQKLQKQLNLATAYNILPDQRYNISYTTILAYCESDESDICCAEPEMLKLSTEPIHLLLLGCTDLQ